VDWDEEIKMMDILTPIEMFLSGVACGLILGVIARWIGSKVFKDKEVK